MRCQHQPDAAASTLLTSLRSPSMRPAPLVVLQQAATARSTSVGGEAGLRTTSGEGHAHTSMQDEASRHMQWTCWWQVIALLSTLVRPHCQSHDALSWLRAHVSVGVCGVRVCDVTLERVAHAHLESVRLTSAPAGVCAGIYENDTTLVLHHVLRAAARRSAHACVWSDGGLDGHYPAFAFVTENI
eukprot:363910-Chlamydomonas_euryale.AAC.8